MDLWNVIGIVCAIFIGYLFASSSLGKAFKHWWESRSADTLDSQLDIYGKWRTTFIEQGTEKHEEVTLRQVNQSVEGETTVTATDGTSERYEFRGTFKDQLLLCTYESTNPKDAERGAFLLRRVGKKKLSGKYVFFSRERSDDEFETSTYTWEQP